MLYLNPAETQLDSLAFVVIEVKQQMSDRNQNICPSSQTKKKIVMSLCFCTGAGYRMCFIVTPGHFV